MPKSKMYGFSNPSYPPLPLSIANGGTGATSAKEAREALGALGYSSEVNMNISTPLFSVTCENETSITNYYQYSQQILLYAGSDSRVVLDREGARASRLKVGNIVATAPARRLEVIDSSAAQLRLSHTPGTHWAELRALSGGGLELASSAGSPTLTLGASGTIRTIEATNLRLLATTFRAFDTGSGSGRRPAIADPTDLPSALAAIISILEGQRAFGFIST